MKNLYLIVLILSAVFFCNAQSVAVYSGPELIFQKGAVEVDSIIFSFDSLQVTPPQIDQPDQPSDQPQEQDWPKPNFKIDAHWCALGTSITWYNDNVEFAEGRFTEGYPSRVLKELPFSEFTNRGESGATILKAPDQVLPADYYTVEFGINDWGKGVAPGTFDDYLQNTGNGTFAAVYRQFIDRIYSVSPDAMVVLCTPRKGSGFNNYLPASWDEPIGGVYLREYVELVRQIADYEGLPVADFFAECGGRNNLARLSIDDALHPNDAGYQLMANVLVDALKKVLIHPYVLYDEQENENVEP